MTALFFTALALLGAVFGSFANVVIHRFPRGESISSPPSHCPVCGHPIRWYDNVPIVSWVVLRARCRDCGAPIPWRYPFVEGISALLWVLAGTLFGSSPKTGVAIALFYGLLVLTFIDLDVGRLPNPIVASVGLAGAASVVIGLLTGRVLAPLTASEAAGPTAAFLHASLGVVLGGGVSLGLAVGYERLRRREGFGMGDVKLLAAMGPFLGAYVLMVLFFGSVVHVLAFVGRRALGHRSSALAPLPFGPALAVAAVVVAAWGPTVWGWYIGVVFGAR